MDPVAKAIYERYMKPSGITWKDLALRRGQHIRSVENSAHRGRSPEYWKRLCEENGWDPDIVDEVIATQPDNIRSLENHDVLRNLCEVDIAYGIHFFEELKKRNRVTVRVLRVALEYGLVSERDEAAHGILPPSTNS